MNLGFRSFEWLVVFPLTGALTLGCEEARYIGEGEPNLGGSANSGGSAAQGGAVTVGGTKPTGGSTASGGATSTSVVGGAGGTANVGGFTGKGGATGIGGMTGTAGATGVGGAVSTGGAIGVGGAVSTGGAIGVGGAVSTGGAIGVGGAVGTGGKTGIGGAVTTGGTTGVGGAIGTGGTIGVGGAVAVGGVAGTTNPSPCGVLAGEWTVVPTVTASAIKVDISPPANMPKANQQLNPIGLRIRSLEDKCYVQMLPAWGAQIAEINLAASNGQLVYTSPTRGTRQLTDCGANDWYTYQVTLSSVVDSADSRRFQWVGDWSVTNSSNVTTLTAGVTMEGSLQPGLPTLALTGYRSVDGDRSWCQTDAVPTLVSHLLPWDEVNVESNVPASDVLLRLVALESLETVSMTFAEPASSFEPGQVVVGRVPSWSRILGKTMQVRDPLQQGRQISYQFASVGLATQFAGDSLSSLTTQGTKTLELVNDAYWLRLAGTACLDTVYAAARLNVIGKQFVWINLRNNHPAAALSVKVFSLDGTVTEARLTDYSTSTTAVYLATLSVEQSQVGVQVTAKGSCASSVGVADISIQSITATTATSPAE